MKRLSVLILILLLSGLSGCKHWWGGLDDENPYQGMTARQLFVESQQFLSKKQYTSAIKRLEALDVMYPFNDYAEQADLNLVYAYYKKEDYPSTAASAERFIHLYPRAKHVDYAYYMKALANYRQIRTALANVLPMDESWRDPGTKSQAYSDFATLIQKFPDSQYKENALKKMIVLRNMFAQHELNLAEFYYERKMYVAAAERASYTIKTYPQAPATKQALAVLYYSDLAMGLQKAADEALVVYQATYQGLPKLATLKY